MSSLNFERNRQRLIEAFYQQFIGGESFETITQARSFAANIIGSPVRPGQPIAKAVEEAIEQAIILTAKDIIKSEHSSEETFDRLVDLYYRQPTLGTRTSTSIEMQAYSTTVPLAYLAGKMAGIDESKTVYEPTAGRGALLLLSNPENVIANELDTNRVADLKSLGYQPTQMDAALYHPDNLVDVVIANPPFGKRKAGNALEQFQIGAADSLIRTSELDQVIVWQALEAMKDDGQAALIIGSERGTDEQRLQKYNTVRVRKFFYNLYRQYNIDDHFTVDGRLYSRQGAAFPVDIIVIKGRKASPYLAPDAERSLPSVDLPKTYQSYQELKSLLPEEQNYEHSNANNALHIERAGLGTHSGRQPSRSSGNARDSRGSRSRALPNADGKTSPVNGRAIPPADPDEILAEPDTRAMRNTLQNRSQHSRPGGRGSPSGDRRKPLAGEQTERGSPFPAARSKRSNPASESHRSGNQLNPRRVANSASQPDAIANLPLFSQMPITPEPSQGQQNGQVKYRPRSQARGLDSYVPLNLERPIQTALENLERQVGDIDQFVVDTLNFGSVEKLHQAMAAEQVDGVALAVKALQSGKAALIGDDTGLGKGRQMASAIKYALETGNIPVFVTKDPGLYADIVRDLIDIGLDTSQIRPFMTNSSETIPLPDGRTLKSSPASHQREMNQMKENGELLSHYNMVFSTYSQLQTVNGKDTERRRFLMEIAPQAIGVLDEAHEAGSLPADNVVNRAVFTRMFTGRVQGVFFASATAIKRPDVADLYARRMNIADAMSVQSLQTTLELGGTPLQQVASAMMAADGQYIRRARTYDGVEVGSKVVETNHADADQLGEIMRAILKFDKEKAAAVSDLNSEVRAFAKSIGVDNSTGLAGAKSTNFSSIMWNVVDQAALSRKADAVADYAISVFESGEKPFIGLSNTMGSFIDQYVKGEDIKSGDSINVSFQDVLARYLQRSRDVSIKDYNGAVEERRPLTDRELGNKAVEQYQKAEKLINQASFSAMPVSPIDWIRHRIESAGYTFGELTGRTARLEYDADGNATYHARGVSDTSKAAKLEVMDGFNNGRIDVGIGNRSASTGFSMHSSEKFLDQKRRHFMIAQPERDINVFKQFVGRFHRTGQVNAPKISLITGNTPDEKRPAAVLAKKLASLNANTTAARQGGLDFEGIPDYLNEVGDQVVSDMMRFDPDLSERLYDPIYVTEDSTRPVVGAVAKVTGCLPILPVAEQVTFYRQLDEEYQATLARYIALGENPLEASNVDLDARTLASADIVPRAEEVESVFAEGIRADIVDVKVQSKPKPQIEVINDVRASLGMSVVRKIEEHDRDMADTQAIEAVDRLYEQADSLVGRYIESKKAEYIEQESDPEKRAGKIDKLEIRTSKQLEILSQIRRFRPGQTVRVTASNERVYYGAITAVKKKGKSLDASSKPGAEIRENPVIPSKWEIAIALADSERQISIPLSKLNTSSGGQGTYAVSIAAFSLEDGDIYESFDNKQGNDRELRVLLRGNLLRLGDTTYQSKGDLVVATMSNGQPEPVMLMESGFDLNKEMTTSPVVLPNGTAVHQFMQITRNAGVVKTLDTAINFKRQKSGEYVLHTGKTRKDIYQDAALREAAGGAEFVSIADRMELIVAGARLDAVVDYLKEGRGKAVAAFSDHEAARDLLGIKMPEVRLSGTVEEVIEREGLAPSVDMANLDSLREKLAASYQAEPVEPQIEPSSEVADNSEAQLEEVPDLSSRDVENARSELDSLFEAEPAAQPQINDASLEDQREQSDGSEQEMDSDDVEQAGDCPHGSNSFSPRISPAGESAKDSEEAPDWKPIQPAYKHRLPCEQDIAQFLHESGIAPQIAKQDDFNITIENAPHIPLSVESHRTQDGKLLYLAHYIEQNGDMFHDGELVFKVKDDGRLLFDEVAARGPRGEIRGYDTDFAGIFARNIVEQGFAQAAIQQLNASPESQEVQANSPVWPENVADQPDQPTDEELSSESDEADFSLEDLAFVDQLVADYDGDSEALTNAILDGEVQLPSTSQGNGIEDESETTESGQENKTDRQPESSPSTEEELEATEDRQLSLGDALGSSAPPAQSLGDSLATPTSQEHQPHQPDDAPEKHSPLPADSKPLVEAEEPATTPQPAETETPISPDSPVEEPVEPLSRPGEKAYEIITEPPTSQPVEIPGVTTPPENTYAPIDNSAITLSETPAAEEVGYTVISEPPQADAAVIIPPQEDVGIPSRPLDSVPRTAPEPREVVRPAVPIAETDLFTDPSQNANPSEQMVSMPVKDFDKALRAAIYIEDSMMIEALDRLAEEQPDSNSISMSRELKSEAEMTRKLARLKLQNELATDIVPLARQLIQQAEYAGLVEQKGDTKTFVGKNYAVESRKVSGSEKIDVYCRQSGGHIHAVDGKVEKTQQLQVKDRDRFINFAAKTPAQLRQAMQRPATPIPRKTAGVEM